MSKRVVCLSAIFTILTAWVPARADEFDLDSIETLMRKVATYGFNNLDGGGAANLLNDWSRGTFMTGVMGTYRVTQDQQYIDSTLKWGEAHNWQPNMSLPTHPDNMCCMQTYCEMYIVDPRPENEYRYLPSKEIIDNRLAQNPEGSGWFWWEDGLYMGPPVIAMVGHIAEQDSYWDHLTNIFFSCRDAYYDAERHMWYWKAEWVYPLKTTAAGNPELWGPGNAWVIGGMIRCMKYMPEGYARRGEWIALFQEFCEALRAAQQPDGFWRTQLYEPAEFPDPESSCTSFFTYAMCLGILYGLLDIELYLPVVEDAWSALVTCVRDDGLVGRCQPWSLAPGGAPLWHNTPEGQGAFMLAGEGVHLLISGGLTGIHPNTDRATKPLSASPYPIVKKISPFSTVRLPDGACGFDIYDVRGRLVKRYSNDAGSSKQFRFSSVTGTDNVFFVRFR